MLPSVSSGNVEAISLCDIYSRATDHMDNMPITQALKIRDPGWEQLKKTNLSSFIPIYRCASVTASNYFIFLFIPLELNSTC